MATSPFGHRAKDCCVFTDTVVKKMAISTFGYRAKDCCAIPDTIVRKTGTETKTNIVILLIQLLRNSQHLHLNMSNAGKGRQRYEDIASMI